MTQRRKERVTQRRKGPKMQRESRKRQTREELNMISPDLVRQRILELMNTSIETHVRCREAIKQGRHEGASELLLRLLTRRLGPLTVSLKHRIKKLSLPKIMALAESLLDFKCRSDLAAWLKKNSERKAGVRIQ